MQEAGLAGMKNGELLTRANEDFDVLILADKNLRYQQNMKDRKVAIIELPTNRWPVVKSLVDKIAQSLQTIERSAYITIEANAK